MDRLRHFYVVGFFGRLGSREGGVSRLERVGNGYCFSCVRRGRVVFQDGMDKVQVAELRLYILMEVA
jgi:hypothetical protein